MRVMWMKKVNQIIEWVNISGLAESYLGTCQTSIKKIFTKIVNNC